MALTACWRWRIWGTEDFRIYQEVCQYPVGRDLWFGHIHQGQALQEIVDRAPAHYTRQYGRFACLTYYPGRPPGPGGLSFSSLSVIAKDGRLVSASAGSCTWSRVFFDMGAEDAAEWDQCLRRAFAEADRLP
jgi:hypothetical protein